MTVPPTGDPLTAVCTYRVRPGCQERFEALLGRHLPTLRTLGLIDDGPARTLRRTGGEEGLVYVEVFAWATADAAERAAEVPEVISVWEPMASLCEARDGRPPMEFPRFADVAPAGG